MSHSSSTNLGSFDMSFIQDVSRSVDQLCNQMSINNIVVPRFNPFTDVFDFLSEFEVATTALSEGQKLTLLAKSFPQGHHREWYETELVPLMKGDASWASVKKKVIERFSDTEDRDRHFLKLRELKYNPDSGHRLLDFVENIAYSYKKAYPAGIDEEACIRYIKAAIPASLRSTLSMISGYSEATNLGMLKKAIKQYDSSRVSGSGSRNESQAGNAELVSLLKEMISNIKREGEVTRTAMVAAIKATNDGGYRSNQYGENRPARNSYSPRRQDYRGSPRGQSPNIRDTRGQSPRRHNYGNQVLKEPESKGTGEQPNKQVIPKPLGEAFNSEAYYAKFGKPPNQCNECGYWHWNRHCINHLN